MMIDVESLSKLMHESGRSIDGNAHRMYTCTYKVSNGSTFIICDSGGLWDVMHNGAMYRRKGEICPRCSGTSVEPFLSWDEITEKEREDLRIRSRYLLDCLVIEDK
jgi:hypothetical protein